MTEVETKEFPTTDPRLGWVMQHDPKSLAYPVRLVMGTVEERPRTWWQGPVLDQGMEGSCVGHGWAHELMGSPKPNRQLDATTGHHYAVGIYKEAQRIDEWEGECVDYETECLTLDGWKSGHDLREGDSLLTFDIETEQTRWAVVEKVHRHASAPYRIWSQRGFAVAVTDNHRWPVRLRANGSGFSRPFRMTTTSEWRSGDELIRSASCSDLPTDPKWEDDFVELIGWVMSEGYYRPETRRGNGVCVPQKVHRQRVSDLMERLGVAPGYIDKIGCQHWEITGELARQVREVAPGRAPRSDWLRSLTLRQLRLILDVCVLADGCTTSAFGNRKSRDVFTQKTGPILDSWLVACSLAGHPVSRARFGAGSGGDVETWTMRGSNSVEIRNLESGLYVTGPVWCPQTEVGTFVARRGGAVFITGNSYSGTSVLAGAKIVQSRGYIGEYRWCFGVEDVRDAVISEGPVVIGIPWHEGMYGTRESGLVEVSGGLVGGHCLLITGYHPSMRLRGEDYNERFKVFRWRNSWGPDYGVRGNGFIRYEDLRDLLKGWGEACVPMARRTVRIS